jgi:acyl-CoA-binding protein
MLNNFSAFDLFHASRLEMLEAAWNDNAIFLIVACKQTLANSDRPGKTNFSTNWKWNACQLKGCKLL